ncbi:MAG: Glu/Leu/Phe/Val dehydrogenase, partial [Blastocatellia bacterium]|nr:Glu/Leu/Phe/Val dehydrogenase [Blastocatellia bacterium]
MVTNIQKYNEHSLFESMMARFDHAAELLNLDPNLYKILRTPSREIAVNMPILRVSGDMETFVGYRVQHNVARGTMQGG